MENLDSLYQWLQEQGVFLFDRQLPFSNEAAKAVTIKLNRADIWGIYMDMGRIKTAAEEEGTAFHEAGHYATGTTHEVCSPFDLIQKHEHKANKWAIMRKLSVEELDDAVADGCTEMWELAERFNVPEDFMRRAVCWYTHGNLATELYFQ